MKRLVALLFALLLVVSACDGGVLPTTTEGAPEDTTTTEAPETTTTEAPETTTSEAPVETTTTAPDDETDDETPWWLLLVVFFALLVIVMSLIRRGSRKKVTVVPGTPTWKDHARAGYADARWLYDAMGEDVAVWRGNAQFDGSTAVGASAGTGQAETWSGMQSAMDRASAALYQLEASAPDNRSAEAARSTIATMRATRAALDSRAEARYTYRKSESEGADQATLVESRDREVRASRNLTEARNAYASALTNLSTLA